VTTQEQGGGIAGVVGALQQRLDEMPAGLEARRVFMATYMRTTMAVGAAIEGAQFEDPEWVERWDVVFADLYIRAYDAIQSGGPVARPWRLAFDAPADLPALRLVLLGINAHINYDLPQALIGVISEADFEDPALMARRNRDHERIDGVLSSRVSAEDTELGDRPWLDRLLTPFNRAGTKRFLAEARRKVWHNTYELHAARLAGEEAYAERLGELELLSAAKIADLLEPRQVLLHLAFAGFGVTLPPPA
jgi:uncharacterized protein DUF5995